MEAFQHRILAGYILTRSIRRGMKVHERKMHHIDTEDAQG